MAETSNPVPPDQPAVQPNFTLLDARIEKALDTRGLAHGGGGGNMGGMAHDERVSKLEVDVGSIKGSLDWAKIAVSIVSAVALGGFAVIVAILLNVSAKVDTQNANLAAKIDGITSKITDEFRSQRADQSAQISSIAAAMAAAKAAPPQVVLVPAPSTAPSEQP